MMKGMQLLFCHIVPAEASAPRLFVNSRRINSLCHYALRESFDKSFVEERSRISLVVTLRYVDATIGASEKGILEHIAYIWFDAFLPVRRLPPSPPCHRSIKDFIQ